MGDIQGKVSNSTWWLRILAYIAPLTKNNKFVENDRTKESNLGLPKTEIKTS